MSQTECLIPNCDRNTACRGLCTACYQTAKREIQLKRTTEQELMDRGLMLPKYHNNKSAVRQALLNTSVK